MNCTIGTDIQEAAQCLRNGFTVGIPTETVYGLAANAFDEDAVLQIFKTKNRPTFDPLIVHVGSIETVRQFTTEIPSLAFELLQYFWPGPLTLLLQRTKVIPDLVTSGMPTVGVRMPDHPLTLELLRSIDFPLAAPSANPFGYISPTTAQHVYAQLGHLIPYIMDGGPCRVGVESTIVSVNESSIIVHRLGGIEVEQLKKFSKEVIVNTMNNSNPLAPGMLDSHYAPKKPLYFGTPQTLLTKKYEGSTAIICLKKPSNASPEYSWYELSPEEDINAAASMLFSTMRLLDTSQTDQILAFEFPDIGLGKAINDRLRRASFK